jgi:hypothetical protein
MKKKYGKNEAGDFRAKNTVIMIVSIIFASLFIGMAIEPVVSGDNVAQEIETQAEDCIPCKNKDNPNLCRNCKDAVRYVVNVTWNYINVTYPWEDIGEFPGWRMELVLTIVDGLQEGISDLKDQDFKIITNEEELKENVSFYMDKFLHPNQNHTITVVIMTMAAIFTGVSSYLLQKCVDPPEASISSPSLTYITFFQRIVIRLLMKLNLIFFL